MNYSQHPLSAAFPAMSDDEYSALVDDIRTHGQRDVATLSDGMVIDGWHRYKACVEIGIPCRLEELVCDDAIAFVRSKNQHRRHYQRSQQAAIEVSLTEWAESHRPNKGAPGAPLSTNKEMAGRAGTGERTIVHAKRAQEAGLGEMVRDGKISAKQAAEIAKNPDLAKQVGRGEKTLPQAVEELTGKRPGAKKTISPIIPESVNCAADEYELQEAQEVIKDLVEENNTLKDRLAVDSMDASEEGKLEAATIISGLREQVRKMSLEIEAITKSRNAYQIENGELRKQLKRMQKAK